MTEFVQFCHQTYQLDAPLALELLKNAKTKTFKKDDYILKKGEVCRHLFFINKGFAKICFVKDDKEFNMQFFAEHRVFTIFDSYLTQTPSNFMLIAIENTTLTLIPQKDVEKLCGQHHGIETFLRKLISVATIKMMKRISETLEENATKRYNQFVKENHAILQRISLGNLSNYLGITQQSLSRIRAKK
ncbi:MAG TPA: Crp/Fnr family transcriptional regulator [Bacteroidia bacterium]|nr:Crp/Fnr family transcriptional regulator [Bacteroidia bacterium]